jgi:hypothetical protein
MAIEGGCKGLECDPDIEALADEGRGRRYGPTTMPADEGRRRLRELDAAWVKSPRLGTAYPKIDREDKDRLEQAWTRLHALLESLRPAAPPADPLGETIRLLKGCGKQAKIVRYLWTCVGREALIETIAKDLYNARDAMLRRVVPTVRRQVERNRDSLDAKKAPLRLIISANGAQLVDATPGE